MENVVPNMRNLSRDTYQGVLNALPPKMAIRLLYFRKLGRVPSFSQPKDFNEKIQVSKLIDRNPLMTVCSDKVLVKDYVAGLIGDSHVIPTIWSGVDFPAREERTWPIPFVIKPNHASGFTHFVRSQDELDWAEIETLTENWLEKPYEPHKREWGYLNIERRLLVEPFISSDRTLPFDYKVYVFGGVSHFVQVHPDRETDNTCLFYDRTWRKCNFTLKHSLYKGAVAAPKNLEKILFSPKR